VTEMAKWICFDGKCIYARVSYVETLKPKYASALYTQLKTEMVVYCVKKHKVIKKVLKDCRDFQNMTLTRYP
jgi:hypothetical protein